MSKKINYRNATVNDLAQLLEFEQGIISAERPYNGCIKSDPVSYYDIKELILKTDSTVIVAESDDLIVASGYAKILPSKQYFTHDIHTLLGFMYVRPEFRGLGLNAVIIDELVKWSKSHNIHDIYLDVYSENDAAITAYQKAGFKAHITQMKLK